MSQTEISQQKRSVDSYMRKVIRLVIQTSYIKGVKPQSLLLLAKAGSGKSRHLQSLEKLSCVFYVTDVTPSNLPEFFNEVAYGRKKFLVIEDATCFRGMSKRTRDSLINILKNGIEEGFTENKHHGLEWKSPTGERIQFGLITSITTDSYSEFASSWKKNGFLSRLIPFSYEFSSINRQGIQREISYGIERPVEPFKDTDFIPLKEKPKPESKDVLEEFEILATHLADKVIAEPFRNQKQLIALAETNSVLNGHTVITRQDVMEIMRLSKWINYDFNDI